MLVTMFALSQCDEPAAVAGPAAVRSGYAYSAAISASVRPASPGKIWRTQAVNQNPGALHQVAASLAYRPGVRPTIRLKCRVRCAWS
jgi:hypothetical protein